MYVQMGPAFGDGLTDWKIDIGPVWHETTLNFPSDIFILTQWRRELYENIVEKGEIAEQFHIFSQCFLSSLYLKIL